MPSFLFLTLSRMHATSHSLKKYSPISSLHLPNPIISNQHFDFFLFSALIWFHLPWHSSFLPWQPHIDSLSLNSPQGLKKEDVQWCLYHTLYVLDKVVLFLGLKTKPIIAPANSWVIGKNQIAKVPELVCKYQFKVC